MASAESKTGSTVKYEIEFPSSSYIWHKKFDDCLGRLDEDEDSEIYSGVEQMQDDIRFDREAARDERGVKTHLTTTDGFSKARNKAEKKFYSRNSSSYEHSFDFYEKDNVDDLPERQQDLWWVAHHLKTMEDKSEALR
jgi:hypothetical protein